MNREDRFLIWWGYRDLSRHKFRRLSPFFRRVEPQDLVGNGAQHLIVKLTQLLDSVAYQRKADVRLPTDPATHLEFWVNQPVLLKEGVDDVHLLLFQARCIHSSPAASGEDPGFPGGDSALGRFFITLLGVGAFGFRFFRGVRPAVTSRPVLYAEFVDLSLFEYLLLHVRVPLGEYFDGLYNTISQYLHVLSVQVLLVRALVLILICRACFPALRIAFKAFLINDGITFNHSEDLVQGLNLAHCVECGALSRLGVKWGVLSPIRVLLSEF